MIRHYVFMLKNKQCFYCKTSFKQVRHNQKFCNTNCTKESYKLVRAGLSGVCGDNRKCARCGNDTKGTSKKYCSDKCKSVASSALRNSVRRSRINNVPRFKFSHLDLVTRDSANCAHCNTVTIIDSGISDNQMHIDHIIPLSKGGHDAIYNAQVLCRKCNISKGNKIPDIDLIRAKELWPSDPKEFIRSSKISRIRKDNKSGVKGVFFNKGANKWMARIDSGKKRVTLIQSNDKDIAINYRKCANDLLSNGVKFDDLKKACKELLDATN